jgi:ABC-type nitrate/sulfonate/bicarbonate transport system substrate-binding protein
LIRSVFALTAAAVLATTTGCTAGLGGPASSRAARDGVIRFTFAPDPIWDYMNDSGILDEFEEKGVMIETSATWDEFGLFAGGHADIISSASFEVPGLEEQTQRETVVIGRYNSERSRILVRAGDSAHSLADLRGKRLGVFTTVSGTLVWSALVKQMHDLDLQSGGGDFDLVVADIQNLSNLLARGEIDACICYPDLSARELREGSVRALYDGKSSAELFAELNAPGHDGPMGNVFVARRDWVEGHPAEVAAFLDLWNRGLQEWRAHRDEIIEHYPQHFAVESPADIAFMKDFVTQHDWVATDVRFDEQWAADESSIFDLMRQTGVIGDDVEDPAFLPTEGVNR